MHIIALVLVLLLLTACTEVTPTSQEAVVFPDSKTLRPALKSYKQTTDVAFLAQVELLGRANAAFLAMPNEANLLALQDQWLQTHLAFTRAQFGLITQTEAEQKTLYQLESWPIQPGFIDNLPDYPNSGIIQDVSIGITKEELLKQHGITHPEEIVLGFHAMELLIFTRPVSDFQPDTNQFAERRRQMLKLIMLQLTQDAASVVAASNLLLELNEADLVMDLFLMQASSKTRQILRESNLVAAQGTGHSLSRDRSLVILREELMALQAFFVTEVNVAGAFKESDPATYGNFMQTVESAAATVEDDELAMANVPLVLSALSHQLEAFQRAVNHP